LSLADPLRPRRARLFEKIDIERLLSDLALELGDLRSRLGQLAAAPLCCRSDQGAQLTRAGFGAALAIQSLRPMGLPRLDPVMQKLARYPKLAGHRQNAFASFGALDRLQFERRRKRSDRHFVCHRSSLGITCHRN
jgi:hypothetical protein